MSETAFPAASMARTPAAEAAAVGCADAFVRRLEQRGVEVVFAYPGGASLALHQALLRSRRIRTVLPRHEQGGIFAAEGYARATGRAGVCMATSGPGATNFVTGIADAFMDSIPLVVITGQVPRALLGKRAFQEVDVLAMTRAVTKRQYQILDPARAADIVDDALAAATEGRPGPVIIDFPKDVQIATLAHAPRAAVSAVHPRSAVPPVEARDLERIAQQIEKARKPVIYAGGGVISAGASQALARFARRTGIPVTTTLLGCGAFPESDPQSLRWLGMHGAAYANWAVDEADLLLAFGVRFDDRVTGRVDKFCQHGFIVHADIDPSEIGKNKPAHFGLVADLSSFLTALDAWIAARGIAADFAPWRARLEAMRASAPFRYDDDHVTIAPQLVIEKLYELTRGEAIITTGVGQHQMWAAQFYRFDTPRRLLTSGGLGAMGFGYPAALGAKIAHPDREVIDIDGDGSFLMNVQELATARVERIAAKAIILDNQHLGMVQQWEDHLYNGIHAHTDLSDPRDRDRPCPDWVALVQSFGVRCERVARREDLSGALERMLAAREPYVLDVVTPFRRDVLPFIPAGGTVADMIY